MLLIPVVLLSLALLVRDPLREIEPLAPILGFLDHHGFYAELFPHWLLIGFFSFFTGLAFLGALVGVVRFWRAMSTADRAAGDSQPRLGILTSVIRTLTPVFSHDKFGKCESHTSRRMAHLGAFYGFAALFLVSVWAVIALYMINPFIAEDLAYPFGFWNPWKILANVGCIVLILGCIKAILDRAQRPKEAGESTSFDWIFVWLLLFVGVTGLATEILRFVADPGLRADEQMGRTGLQYFAYAVYFVHLVFVFDLLVYLPYSKFAHIVYRTVALVYAEHTGRNEVRMGKA
jgi:quinone-modifying oxidoreductase subunit QmoC